MDRFSDQTEAVEDRLLGVLNVFLNENGQLAHRLESLRRDLHGCCVQLVLQLGSEGRLQVLARVERVEALIQRDGGRPSLLVRAVNHNLRKGSGDPKGDMHKYLGIRLSRNHNLLPLNLPKLPVRIQNLRLLR